MANFVTATIRDSNLYDRLINSVPKKIMAAFAEKNMMCYQRTYVHENVKTSYFVAATSLAVNNLLERMHAEPEIEEGFLIGFEMGLRNRSVEIVVGDEQNVRTIVESCGYCPIISSNGSSFTVVPFARPSETF